MKNKYALFSRKDKDFVSVENRAPSRSRKLGMTFANFLDLGGPQSQPKRKLINISGERGNEVMGQMCQSPQCDHRNKAAPLVLDSQCK